MSLKKKLAATVPFASLLGIRAESEDDTVREDDDDMKAKKAEWAKKAETDDERKQRDDESDGEYVSRMEAMDDEEKKSNDEDGDDADAKKANKAKRAEHEEPDGDEGMESEDDDAKAARARERARCARIIAHGIKLGRVSQAGVFAFDTSLTAKQAISALNAAGIDAESAPRATSGLASRMATLNVPKPGVDGVQAPDASDPKVAAKLTADRIIAAAAKARGEKV